MTLKSFAKRGRGAFGSMWLAGWRIRFYVAGWLARSIHAARSLPAFGSAARSLPVVGRDVSVLQYAGSATFVPKRRGFLADTWRLWGRVSCLASKKTLGTKGRCRSCRH